MSITGCRPLRPFSRKQTPASRRTTLIERALRACACFPTVVVASPELLPHLHDTAITTILNALVVADEWPFLDVDREADAERVKASVIRSPGTV